MLTFSFPLICFLFPRTRQCQFNLLFSITFTNCVKYVFDPSPKDLCYNRQISMSYCINLLLETRNYFIIFNHFIVDFRVFLIFHSMLLRGCCWLCRRRCKRETHSSLKSNTRNLWTGVKQIRIWSSSRRRTWHFNIKFTACNPHYLMIAS